MVLLALPENIRLGWKWVEKANTLAYCITATITAVKSFIVEALISRVRPFYELAVSERDP